MDRIVKGIGGFYYVKTADGIVECKPRGNFRNKKTGIYVGDYVKISINEKAENTIEEILPRKNFLIRPPVSNIDILIIVSSTVVPKPNTFVIDKLCAVCQRKGIEPVIIFNKNDVQSADSFVKIYTNAGFTSLSVSAKTGEGIDKIPPLLKGKTAVFTGNSGAGKSSILNRLNPSLNLQTGEVSKKLGRGRHTTRSAEIFEVAGGEAIDTPGFSSLDIEKMDNILKEDLQYAFRDIEPFALSCRFNSCAHIKEKGCAVREALERGEIEKSRYDSYVQMYEQVKNLKSWQIN